MKKFRIGLSHLVSKKRLKKMFDYNSLKCIGTKKPKIYIKQGD